MPGGTDNSLGSEFFFDIGIQVTIIFTALHDSILHFWCQTQIKQTHIE